MLTVFSEKHALRDAKTELYGGVLVPPFECPIRAEHILQRVKQVQLGEIIAPDHFNIDAVMRIHDAEVGRHADSVPADAVVIDAQLERDPQRPTIGHPHGRL